MLNPDAGAALVEFALVSPAFIALLMGAMEMGYESYMANVLDGTLNRAARSITMQTASDATIRNQLDQDLRDTIGITNNEITLTVHRESVSRYSQVLSRGEPLNDTNHNNQCDPGESYEDLNGNRRFDANAVRPDWGSANDVVVYKVTASFPRLFPIGSLIGLPDNMTLSSTKMLRIQPFGSQARASLLNCS